MTGFSWWGKVGDSWFSGWAGRRAMKDRLRVSERTGELFGVVITTIVFLFLYENQLRGAAFFTSSFGSLAQFFFYGPLFTGMILSFARAIYGLRNAIRPFDCLNMVFLALARILVEEKHIPKEMASTEISKIIGARFSERYVQRLLPDEFKRSERQKREGRVHASLPNVVF